MRFKSAIVVACATCITGCAAKKVALPTWRWPWQKAVKVASDVTPGSDAVGGAAHEGYRYIALIGAAMFAFGAFKLIITQGAKGWWGVGLGIGTIVALSLIEFMFQAILIPAAILAIIIMTLYAIDFTLENLFKQRGIEHWFRRKREDKKCLKRSATGGAESSSEPQSSVPA